jgi:hypothetical protein
VFERIPLRAFRRPQFANTTFRDAKPLHDAWSPPRKLKEDDRSTDFCGHRYAMTFFVGLTRSWGGRRYLLGPLRRA